MDGPVGLGVDPPGEWPGRRKWAGPMSVGEAEPEQCPGTDLGAGGRAVAGGEALDVLGPALPWQEGPWVPRFR